MMDLVDSLLAGDKPSLARAITCVESTRLDHQQAARDLITKLMPYTGQSHRIGLTGVPGVGKSTLIESLGMSLTQAGHKVAVLAVDPSSSRTGGSILGDKTRMSKLANNAKAYIRPSPSSGTLGGVTRKTRETILLCEAAGYDIILVETVGVGQSETLIADMVDVFIALMLPGAGDELQGIKKGLLELAEIVFVNKTDGDNQTRARHAAKTLTSALHLITPVSDIWTPRVLTGSALEDNGVEELWATIQNHKSIMETAGVFKNRRQAQQVRWLWSMVEDRLIDEFRTNTTIQHAASDLEAAVSSGQLPASEAAERLFNLSKN